MHLFAIGDLHLSLARKKTMDKFGDNWINHFEKIKAAWHKTITKEDTVLLPGDISWAMGMKDAIPDLDAIQQLPGKKILISGNHDYWWDSTSKLEKAYPEMIFLKNRAVPWGNFWICGTRGWTCPNDRYFKDEDEKIYQREQIRLRLSLDFAMTNGAKEIVLMLHYPPTNDKKEPSAFTEILHKYPVQTVVYGHLHGADSFSSSMEGKIDGVEYHLVSSDYLDFIPKQIY